MSTPITLTELNNLPEADFIGLLGGVFEHSPWVAEQAQTQRPFASVAALHDAMVACVEAAQPQTQLDLIRAHPELAGKAAIRGGLTPDSAREQAGAGLTQCSPEEYKILTSLNQAYRQKFGFPFVLAVRGYDRAGIIGQMERRLQLEPAQERSESLQQIYKIARLRLDELIQA